MMSAIRRPLVIVGALVLVLVIVVALYFIFFAKSGAKLSVSNVNPFSANSGTIQQTNSTEFTSVSGGAGTSVAPGLIEITPGPVAAGVAVFDVPPATTTSSSSTTQYPNGETLVHYIDRESGNVYEYGAINRSLTRISDKTLPGIQLASWTPDGMTALVQFLSETSGSQMLSTYELPANGNGGYFLDSNLAQATAVDSNTIFTLADGTDSSTGTVANLDGTNVQTVFTSPLTSLIVQDVGKTFIATNKASSEENGYAFSIGSGGSFTPILGPLTGLTTLLSPSGKSLLYSYTDGSAMHMGVLDLSSGSVINLPLATLTEKCTWASDSQSIYCAVPTSFSGNLPDDWYQGAVSFTDRIWHIDLASRLATLVVSPSDVAKVDVDAVNLAVDPNNTVLVFRNKKDSSLWAYSL